MLAFPPCFILDPPRSRVGEALKNRTKSHGSVKMAVGRRPLVFALGFFASSSARCFLRSSRRYRLKEQSVARGSLNFRVQLIGSACRRTTGNVRIILEANDVTLRLRSWERLVSLRFLHLLFVNRDYRHRYCRGKSSLSSIDRPPIPVAACSIIAVPVSRLWRKLLPDRSNDY